MDWAVAISVAISVVSLGLSVYTLVRHELGGRIARLTVAWERIDVRTDRTMGSHNELVITNHGPAVASDLSAVVFDHNGGPDPHALVRAAFPLAGLGPGQQFHTELLMQLGVGLSEIELTWNDGRRNQQTLRVPLSAHRVASPSVVVNIDDGRSHR